MNLNDREQEEGKSLKVISLFDHVPEAKVILADPLTDLIKEAQLQDEILTVEQTRTCQVVNENHFPDQSIFILEQQLGQLKRSLDRMKFYLGELDDCIPP